MIHEAMILEYIGPASGADGMGGPDQAHDSTACSSPTSSSRGASPRSFAPAALGSGALAIVAQAAGTRRRSLVGGRDGTGQDASVPRPGFLSFALLLALLGMLSHVILEMGADEPHAAAASATGDPLARRAGPVHLVRACWPRPAWSPLIHAFAWQGALLAAVTTVVAAAGQSHHLYFSAVLTLVLKALLIPWLLHRPDAPPGVSSADVETLRRPALVHHGRWGAGDLQLLAGAADRPAGTGLHPQHHRHQPRGGAASVC